jgi:hypothetical protein
MFESEETAGGGGQVQAYLNEDFVEVFMKHFKFVRRPLKTKALLKPLSL